MFNFNEIQYRNFNLKIQKSDIFDYPLEHFFTTRLTGDTPEPLNSFTISAKDKPELAKYEEKNKKIISEIILNEKAELIMPNQQHTDNILAIKNMNDIKQIKTSAFDGLITNIKNLPLCLVFADCVPILLFDKKNKILACVHAGWRGTAKKIGVKAINIMRDEFGTNLQNIQVAIGSAICKNCFETNKDVYKQLAITINYNRDNIFLESREKLFVDLKMLNAQQLSEVGIKNIDISPYCTSCNNDIFYSYRADNKCTGRHALVAMIKE